MKQFIGFLGLVLLVIGIFLAFNNNATWYSFFASGGTLVLAYLNYLLKNQSLFYFWNISKAKVLALISYLLVTGIIIELAGNFTLHFWTYPRFTFFEYLVHGLFMGYVFGPLFIFEVFVLIKKWLKNFFVALILATLIGVFLHELLNTFGQQWLYTIPNIQFSILGINIVVIIGYFILSLEVLLGIELLYLS